MAKVIELGQPTPLSTLEADEVKEIQPIYCKLAALPKLLGVSRSTALRLLQDAEQQPEWQNITVSISPTLKLAHIETVIQYVRSLDKKWM